MMRIPLLAVGLLLILVGGVAYLQAHTDEGKIQLVTVIACGVVCVVGAAVIGAVQDASRAQLDALRATRSAPVASERVVSPPKPAVIEDPGAHDLFKRAEELHFAKKFPEALELYRKVVADYPDSKAAASAKRQIENLG